MIKAFLWLGFIGAVLLLLLGWWEFPLLIFILCAGITLHHSLFREDWPMGYILTVLFGVVLLLIAGLFAQPERVSISPWLDGLLLAGLGLLIFEAAFGLTSLIYVEMGLGNARFLRQRLLGRRIMQIFEGVIGMRRAFMLSTAMYPLSVHVISEGKSVFPEGSKLRDLGPSLVVVNKGDAVITERFGRFRRIAGRFFMSDDFEYIVAVVDLYPQTDSVEVEDLLTRDGVEVDIELLVRYRVRRGSVDGRYDEFAWDDLLAYDPEAVLAAAFKVDDWQQAVRDQAKLLAQEIVARYTLDDISDPAMRRTTSGTSSPREEVVDEIRRRLEADVERWGVEIMDLAIEKVEVQTDEALRPVRDYRQISWERAIRQLQAETERLVNVIEARGEQEATEFRAEARRRLEQVMNATMAENLGQFLQAVTDGGGVIDPALLQRYVAVLEKVSWLLHQGDPRAIYTIELMEKIAETPKEDRATLFMPSDITLPPGIPGQKGGSQP